MTDHLRPLGAAPLTAEILACRVCGGAVVRNDAARIETLTVQRYRPSESHREAWDTYVREDRAEIESWHGRAQPGEPAYTTPPARFEFATCTTCASTLDRAERIFTAHRHLVASIGSVLRGRVKVALLRLDLLGVPLTDADAEAMTDAAVMLLTDRLGTGGLPLWAEKFSPVHLTGDPHTCAGEPWGHVPVEARVAASTSYRQWEAARLAAVRAASSRPRSTACPSGGCMLCGISKVTGWGTLTWRPFKASVQALGGYGAKRIEGHLCPICAAVHEDLRYVGPTLLERSLFAHLDPDGSKGTRYLELVGLTAWAVSGVAPNPTPWSHLRGGDAVTARLLGETTATALSPDARALVESIAGYLSDDAAAELRTVLLGRATVSR